VKARFAFVLTEKNSKFETAQVISILESRIQNFFVSQIKAVLYQPLVKIFYAIWELRTKTFMFIWPRNKYAVLKNGILLIKFLELYNSSVPSVPK